VRTHPYRITVAGCLTATGREVFADFIIEPCDGRTLLTAVLDESALYGALGRIQMLRLELLELVRLTDDTH